MRFERVNHRKFFTTEKAGSDYQYIMEKFPEANKIIGNRLILGKISLLCLEVELNDGV